MCIMEQTATRAERHHLPTPTFFSLKSLSLSFIAFYIFTLIAFSRIIIFVTFLQAAQNHRVSGSMVLNSSWCYHLISACVPQMSNRRKRKYGVMKWENLGHWSLLSSICKSFFFFTLLFYFCHRTNCSLLFYCLGYESVAYTTVIQAQYDLILKLTQQVNDDYVHTVHIWLPNQQ